jgi:hypothetical protein
MMQLKDSDRAQFLMQADEGGISIYDIVEFIQKSWKQLVAAGIVGAVLGFGAWSFFGSYKAELILLNNTNINTNTNTNSNNTFTNTNLNNNTSTNINSYGLDLVTWRTLQKSLPNLAAQMAADQMLSSDAQAMYQKMDNPKWWSKNIIPTYAISKADAKDLAGISKELDNASTTILSLTVHVDSDSKARSLGDVRLASQFVKSGGAYLQIKSMLNAYEGEAIGTVADIQNQITTIEIEQSYLKGRVNSLEELLKRFPGNAGSNQLVIDPKDSGAKYLPLTTQIIAANNDFNQNNERLIRLNDRLNQIALMKQFLIKSLPLAETEFDGIVLSKSLINIEDELRKGLSANDVKNRQALDHLRSQLLTIEARFTKGLEANTAPVTKKTGMLKAIVSGLGGLVFFTLVLLLARKVLSRLQK